MEEVNKNSGKKWEGESEANRKASRRKADKMKTERRKKQQGMGQHINQKKRMTIRENEFGSWYTACEYGWYYLRR